MISVNTLYASYENKKVFSNVSFSAARGKTALITGRNGSGKSTLCKILSGVKKPDSGSVTLNGACSVAAPFIVPYHLLTVKENINLFLKDKNHISAAESLCGSFAIHDLDILTGELSTGNLHKLILSLCFAKEADVYILDEPFSHLDSSSSEKLQSLIQRREKTYIIASHTEIQSDIRIYLDDF